MSEFTTSFCSQVMLHVVFRLMCAPYSFLSTELPDEGEQDAPFDATDVPSALEALYASNQRIVEAAIYNHSNRQQQDHITLFHADHVKSLGFNVLCTLWAKGDSRGAMQLLSQHCRLNVEDHHLVNANHLDVAVSMGPHFLDHTLYVGAC